MYLLQKEKKISLMENLKMELKSKIYHMFYYLNTMMIK